MSNTVIKVENLSKLYRLGVVGTGTVTHDLNRWWHSVRGKEDPYLKIGEENDRTEKGGDYAWALQDINFEIQQGEVVGIIGKNGAGKSTLLKILSRVTQPTTGSVKVKGRIASLLEVGTGFHPELTGKENIYLNGAILGMTKAEIRSKYDEIVKFSGIQKYIDTPVKRYSSGMYVRLAFAVAAHLEPEILIIDEVLAVGDIEFQKKCLGKMSEVAGEGRTVLFVSHNMAAIRSLCKKGVLLKNGLLVQEGEVEEVINYYIESSITKGSYLRKKNNFDELEKKVLINKAGIKSTEVEEYKDVFYHDEKIKLSFTLQIKEFNPNYQIVVVLLDKDGRKVFTSFKNFADFTLKVSGIVDIDVCIPNKLLTPGLYSFTVAVHVPNMYVLDKVENVCSFKIIDGGSEFALQDGADYGVIYANCQWEIL